ncbi:MULTISPECIES: hypothetical protein [Kitasatospora]|uniref:Uncharacterized protein n=1 Tax=Kitasatospora cystarginea TaxID=58350 RepID=A0ABN3ELT1_9ACTN
MGTERDYTRLAFVRLRNHRHRPVGGREHAISGLGQDLSYHAHTLRPASPDAEPVPSFPVDPYFLGWKGPAAAGRQRPTPALGPDQERRRHAPLPRHDVRRIEMEVTLRTVLRHVDL